MHVGNGFGNHKKPKSRGITYAFPFLHWILRVRSWRNLRHTAPATQIQSSKQMSALTKEFVVPGSVFLPPPNRRKAQFCMPPFKPTPYTIHVACRQTPTTSRLMTSPMHQFDFLLTHPLALCYHKPILDRYLTGCKVPLRNVGTMPSGGDARWHCPKQGTGWLLGNVVASCNRNVGCFRTTRLVRISNDKSVMTRANVDK